MLPQLLLHLVTEADIVNLLFITITALENVSGAVAVSITALKCLELLPLLTTGPAKPPEL